MSGLPPSPPSRTAPIPISTSNSPTSLGHPGSTSHHVRSMSLSFSNPPPASISPSSFSPTTPSPIIAGMATASARSTSFFSTSPRPNFGSDWAKSWAGGGGGGGSAVAEDDEGGVGAMSKSLQSSAGGKTVGWGGQVIGQPGSAAGTASLMGSAGTGTRVVVQPETGAGANQKINGVLRRLSLGGAGLSRPSFAQKPQEAPTPLPTPVTGTSFFPPPAANAVPDLIPDRPTEMKQQVLRGRKPSVGGKGKRGISPTGERMLQGHHGGLF